LEFEAWFLILSSIFRVWLRHHKTIRIIPYFAPRQFGDGLAGEQGNRDRNEFDPEADFGAALGEVSGEQEFVVAEPAIGGLDDVLGRPKFFFWI